MGCTDNTFFFEHLLVVKPRKTPGQWMSRNHCFRYPTLVALKCWSSTFTIAYNNIRKSLNSIGWVFSRENSWSIHLFLGRHHEVTRSPSLWTTKNHRDRGFYFKSCTRSSLSNPSSATTVSGTSMWDASTLSPPPVPRHQKSWFMLACWEAICHKPCT